MGWGGIGEFNVILALGVCRMLAVKGGEGLCGRSILLRSNSICQRHEVEGEGKTTPEPGEKRLGSGCNKNVVFVLRTMESHLRDSGGRGYSWCAGDTVTNHSDIWLCLIS